MGDINLKPSRVQRMQDVDRLYRDTKKLYEDLEKHLRLRNKLSRRIKRLSKQAKRRYPDMREPDDDLSLSLHEHLDEIARTLYVERGMVEDDDDPILRAGRKFRDLFRFLNTLTANVPWL